MTLPLQVGITGGIGSGKSIVVKIFSCLGIPTYDADSRAKILMNGDAELIDQIKKEFGEQSYSANNKLNRRYLAENVFGFPDRLKKLNSLVHPKVGEDYLKWVSVHKQSKYVIKEAALLFESGSAKQLNKIIVITALDSLRIERVMKRDNRTESEVKNIMARQWPQEKLASMADYVIANDESELVLPKVLALHHTFNKA